MCTWKSELSSLRVWTNHFYSHLVPDPNNSAAAESFTLQFNLFLFWEPLKHVIYLSIYNPCSHIRTVPPALAALDLCFGNIADACKAVCRPSFGRWDHSVIHLFLKQKVRVKPVTSAAQGNMKEPERRRDAASVTVSPLLMSKVFITAG